MGMDAWVLVLILVMASSLMGSSEDNARSIDDPSTAVLIRVDKSGKGDYRSVVDAINSVPSNNSALVFIYIKPGIYREKVVVPADKPFIILSGVKANSTIITWNDSAATSSEGTFGSGTLTVLASDFVGKFLTIQNTYGPGSQAVALRVAGDRASFYGCRFLSYQDTLLDDAGRHYFSNCYIQGATDFICGNALSLFQKCRLHSISTSGGAITAQRRSASTENTGFSFVGCKVTGFGSVYLGRAWGPFSRVVFALTYMPKAVLPQGWNSWNDPSNQRTVFYGEYKCYGPGSNVTRRVAWSHSLSEEMAAPFLTTKMIDGEEWIRPPPTHFKKPELDKD